MSQIDVGSLLPYATARQGDVLRAILDLGGVRTAARALGMDPGTVRKTLRAVERKAALQGVAPAHDMTKAVPEPFVARGHSTLYGADGAVKLQWVKTRLDERLAEAAMREAIAALAEDIPRAVPAPRPAVVRPALCNLYTLTDCHVGMRAWDRETCSGNWDLDIAESTLRNAFAHMIDASPSAETGVVCQLGDFLHFDSLQAVTPTHQHILDGDGRYGKVVRVAVRILRAVIDMALCRHERVIVLMAEGNHDPASSVWLRHLFGLLYEQEPRVTMIDSELPYYTHQHGKTMLAFHHGHLSKNGSLPLLFAAQFPQVWGSTTKRYCHTGHRHHIEEKEHSGMVVIQHPTLAARDAYAARGGWIAERQVTAVTYHAEYGEVARNTVTPEMLA